MIKRFKVFQLLCYLLLISCNQKQVSEPIDVKLKNMLHFCEARENNKIISLCEEIKDNKTSETILLQAAAQGFLSVNRNDKAIETITIALIQDAAIAHSIEILALCYYRNGNIQKYNQLLEMAASLTLLLKEKRVISLIEENANDE